MFIYLPDIQLEIKPPAEAIMSAIEYWVAVLIIGARDSVKSANRRPHNSALGNCFSHPHPGTLGAPT